MLVSLHVLAVLFLFFRILTGHISAVTWFDRGSDPETARVDKGHSHLIFPVKAGAVLKYCAARNLTPAF
jgi:hypothetical protein